MPGQTTVDRLQQLEEELLALGNLVEVLLIESADLLCSSDLPALERLDGTGHRVLQQRLAIEMSGLSLIAGSRPVDEELRLLVAMIEIAAELERLADHAQRVAWVNSLTVDSHLRDSLVRLRRLAADVQSLLDDALMAFTRRDAGAARIVGAEMSQVQNAYRQIRRELLRVVKDRPRLAHQAILLSRAAHNLRRAADRIGGVCEWVVYLVEGLPEAGVWSDESLLVRQQETSVL